MTRFVVILFGLLTLGAAYLTIHDAGVVAGSDIKANIRDGGIHRYSHAHGSYRGGK